MNCQLFSFSYHDHNWYSTTIPRKQHLGNWLLAIHCSCWVKNLLWIPSLQSVANASLLGESCKFTYACICVSMWYHCVHHFNKVKTVSVLHVSYNVWVVLLEIEPTHTWFCTCIQCACDCHVIVLSSGSMPSDSVVLLGGMDNCCRHKAVRKDKWMS